MQIDMDMYAPPAPEDNDQIQGYPPPFQPHQANQVMTTHGVSVPSYQVVVLQSQESARAVSSNSQEAGASEVSPEKEASMANALILAIGLGMFGAHHFYLRRYRFGVVYLCTLGLLGCGYIIDWFRVPCLVKDYNQKIRNNQPEVGIEERSVSDTYVLWFPMGLLGFHHYYLRRWGWALLYTFTIGLFGIGWLVDLFRIPFLVRKCNNKILMQERLQERMPFRTIRLTSTYLMAVPPIGLFGSHHYYMGNPKWGLLYTFTLGLCGFGWLVDLARMSVLVDRSNARRKNVRNSVRHREKKYLDDAYVLHFPFGLLGFHHFYLERYGWGVLYLFTIGCFSIGWLIDFVRMPSLVKTTNKRILNEQDTGHAVQVSMAGYNQPRVYIIAPNVPGQVPFGTNSVTPGMGMIPGAASAMPDQPPSYDSVVNCSSSQTGLPGACVGASYTNDGYVPDEDENEANERIERSTTPSETNSGPSSSTTAPPLPPKAPFPPTHKYPG